MKLNFKKRLYVVFVVSQIFLIVVLVYSSKMSFDKLKNSLLEKRISDFKNSFSYEMNQQERELFILAEELKYNYEFLKIFEVIKSKNTVNSMNFFDKLKMKFSINITEIGDKNGTVLYRFHRPKDKGDNKINQKIISDALKGNDSVSIEYGHSGLALRYATPFLNDTTLLIGKKLNSEFLKLLQRGEIKGIFLMEDQKFVEFSDFNLYSELKENLPLNENEEGPPNIFIYSKQSTYFSRKESNYLCVILNYSLPVNTSYSKLSFYILYDDTQLIIKQNKLISDIVIVSIAVMIFSIIISYLQINNEAMKLERTESYLEQVQKKLADSEKIGALGSLVAGFAHKLNSPLSAILAGISNIEVNSNDLYLNLFDFIQKLDTNQIQFLKEEIKYLNKVNFSITRKEERELKTYLKGFISLNYPNHFQSIEDIEWKFVFIGATKEEKINEYMKTFHPESLSVILTILEHFIKSKKNIDNVSKAANHSKEFIKSLKFFSERDVYGSKINSKILELIQEETLPYKHIFDSRITLILEVDPGLTLSCYPIEMKRVFHELLQNSIQAIQGTGEIFISTKIRNSEIDLIIKDNGIGVPQEIRQKLFEPFATSRLSGEGIGLGLYISKKIIEIHKGGIVYYYQDPYTVFQITLPI